MIAIGAAAVAALILVAYLLFRPRLSWPVRIALALGIGGFPMVTAATGNLHGFEATKTRRFCGGCHVMTPYANDSEDPKSMSLAARHARNPELGDANCYYCHADYGMFGTVVTKLGGMRHVYLYVTEYRDMSLAEAREKIHLLGTYKNATCMQCHSTELPDWLAIDGHKGAIDEIRSGATSCVSNGCHGPAHPFSKVPYGAKPDVAEGGAP